MNMDPNFKQQFDRRGLLKWTGIMAGSGLLSSFVAQAAGNPATVSGPDAVLFDHEACVLTPQQGAGPYHLDIDLVRRDIRENQPGLPLTIVLEVVQSTTCAPLADAVIDIWHAAADGSYSGYQQTIDGQRIDTRGQTYLRGIQVTDARGRVEYQTIYPGWYPGRAVHVHFNIHLGRQSVATSQLYFPDAATDEVYALEPYAQRPERSVRNADDGIMEDVSHRTSRLIARIGERQGLRTASLRIGVAV